MGAEISVNDVKIIVSGLCLLMEFFKNQKEEKNLALTLEPSFGGQA